MWYKYTYHLLSLDKKAKVIYAMIIIAMKKLIHFAMILISWNRTLDVQPNRITVGGIRSLEPILQRRAQVQSHDFVGCIMEFAVNGRPLEPSQALSAQGILDRYVLHAKQYDNIMTPFYFFEDLL